METGQIIEMLKRQRTALRLKGVKHLSLFGSYARGEAADGSDIDIAVELDDSMHLGLVEFANIRRYLADILDKDVDLVSEPVLRKPRLQAEIDRYRLAAF